MSFGLKNTEASYQRLVNKIFTDLISKTIKVYVDNMLAKSLSRKDSVKYLDTTFQIWKDTRWGKNLSNAFSMLLLESS